MPEVGSQNTTSAGYFHFLFGNLNPGGNESMTKQRIGVLVVSALLAVASLAQAPPAKQKPAAKKSGGAVSGGPVMPGSEQWMDVPAAALVGTQEHPSIARIPASPVRRNGWMFLRPLWWGLRRWRWAER